MRNKWLDFRFWLANKICPENEQILNSLFDSKDLLTRQLFKASMEIAALSAKRMNGEK